MQSLLTTGILNAIAATLVACGVLAIAAVWRNPFVNRGLWLAVLLKFVIPPLVLLPLIEWPSSQEPSAAPMVNVAAQPEPPRTTSSAAPVTSEVAAAADAVVLPSSTFPPDSTVPPLLPQLAPASSIGQSSSVPVSVTRPFRMSRPRIAPGSSWEAAIDLAGVLWLGGALAFFCIALMRLVSFHRALSRAAIAPDVIQRRTAELAALARMAPTPVVRITSGHTPPLAWRIANGATILLPAELVERLPAAELDAILAHELTHLHRGDDRFRWLEFVIVTAFWWCPSAWFARRRLHEAEERCCDADVLRTFPALASHYASALLAALDCLAPAPRHVVGTPFFSRGTLVQRFESITASRQPQRPSRAISWLLGATGVALLVVTPIAASAEDDAEIESSETELPSPATAPQPAESSNSGRYAVAPAAPYAVAPAAPSEADGVAVELDQTLTVRMPDGKTRQGRIVFDDQGVPALRWDAAEPASSQPRSTLPMEVEHLEIWDVSLDECLALIVKNNRFSFAATDDRHTIRFAPELGADLTLVDATQALANQMRDVQDAYWELWYCYEHLDAEKGGRDLALQTWRRVKALQRVGSVGGEDNAEAESRAHYYLLRGRVNTANSDLFRVENRLRYVLGLAAEDGRLIRPSVAPNAEAVTSATPADAIANRPELIAARFKLREREVAVADAKAAMEEAPKDDLVQRQRRTAMRHAELLLEREQAIVKDLELEVSHQLGDALRDVDLHHSMVKTNDNRRAAARDEVDAVERLYKVGQITLDRVLLAQIRRADAESAYARSLADYARAIKQLHYRTGATIPNAGYRIEQAAAENSPPISHRWAPPVPASALAPNPGEPPSFRVDPN
jgi:beta-lactamase regulating signal transducer with metallopeptidase domain